MAPSASKNCYRNARMLVAHQNAQNNLKYPVMTKGTDGVFLIDDKDCYTDVLARMASYCMKPVSRIFYIDSDDDELPIDSDVEFKEALKLIGQRSSKGQLTSMRIETRELQKNEKKRVKKSSKVPRVKGAAKPSDPLPPRKTTSSNRAESEPKLQKNCVSDESSVRIPRHGISQTWLKNYLEQFKKELMTDFESLLQPYISEQKRMSDLIASLRASIISEKSCVENVALSNMKEQTESDHNYSASVSCMNTQVGRAHLKTTNNSEESGLKISPLNEDEELPLLCSFLDEGDDDNLSIYSGEISVTESESDGSADDFVEVPLPSCFDVVAFQEGSMPKRVTKEKKHTKTSLKVKVGKVCKYESLANSEDKPQPKTNALQNKKPEIKSELLKNQFTHKEDNQPVIQALIAPMESNNDTIDGNFADNEDYEEVEVEIEDDYVDVGEEEGHNFDCEYSEEYAGELKDKVENGSENGNQESMSSSTYPQSFWDQSRNGVLLSDKMTKQQGYAPTMDSFEQNGNIVMGGVQEKSLESDLHPSPQNVTQFNMVNAINTPPNPRMVPKVPLYSTQSHQSPMNSQQPLFVLTGNTVPGSLAFMQLPEATSMPKPLQPIHPVQQTLLQQKQPLMKIPQPIWKTLQAVSAQRFIETAQAAVQAQHQQVIRAAQRAAVQAQQTQALVLPQSLPQQSRTSATFQENLPTVSGVRSNINSQTAHPMALLGENHRVQKTGNSQVGSMPRQMQEAAQELKLWNEVDHVDLELRKWVQMCQQLMESIPKQVDDSSPTMPECLKKLASTAGKTHQDLEKVYQNFRKEVQMVSSQMDAQKQQKQNQECQLVADNPIVILPEKLMNIISATLNTTFNILGNIAKLGVAPSSVLSEHNTATLSVEKPQPHISTNITPVVPAMGNTNNVRLGYAAQTMPHAYYQSYISPLSMLGTENVPVCGVMADPLANQEPSLAFRMRPVGAASTFGPNYPLIWGQNVSTYTTAQTLGQTQTQPTMLGQPQATQQQTAPTMPRQLPQQMLPQLPLQLALHHHQQAMSQMAPIQPQMQPQLLQPLQAQFSQQQISRDDTSGRHMNPQDNNRIEATYNGMQVHDYAPGAPDTASVCYSNVKTVPSVFCAKNYGGIMKN